VLAVEIKLNRPQLLSQHNIIILIHTIIYFKILKYKLSDIFLIYSRHLELGGDHLTMIYFDNLDNRF
jgi:hypothetical protein